MTLLKVPLKKPLLYKKESLQPFEGEKIEKLWKYSHTSSPYLMKLRPYIQIARPDHWFKNIFMVPGMVLVFFFDSSFLGELKFYKVILGVWRPETIQRRLKIKGSSFPFELEERVIYFIQGFSKWKNGFFFKLEKTVILF